MSLDLKYRPVKFSDVLGQETTIKVMRRLLLTGRGREQSYLLAGPFGEGKTSVARILARGLLCEAVTPEGDPCDKCESCLSLLERGSSLDYIEFDAANNSGKEDIKKITEEIQYATFSGKRRIYTIDESHSLSKEALDSMLLPLEETFPGSTDKKLVCIFCTTEPEKMRAAILSRCAPAFVIHPVTSEQIADRLETICQKEGIEYDKPVLQSIAEITEGHVRNAIKAVEGVSLLGKITKESVTSYLHLDLNVAYLGVLEGIGKDLSASLQAAKDILNRASPVTVYGKLAEVSMLAYQTHIGAIPPPSFWDAERLKALGEYHKEALLMFAEKFSCRPGKPTSAMLFCDLACLHHGGGVQPVTFVTAKEVPSSQGLAKTFSFDNPPLVPSDYVPPRQQVSSYIPPAVPVAPPPATVSAQYPQQDSVVGTFGGLENLKGNLPGTVTFGPAVGVAEKKNSQTLGNMGKVTSWEVAPEVFAFLLALRVSELRQDGSIGPTRRIHLGGSRVDSSGGSED